jgi:hypothetical protein
MEKKEKIGIDIWWMVIVTLFLPIFIWYWVCVLLAWVQAQINEINNNIGHPPTQL